MDDFSTAATPRAISFDASQVVPLMEADGGRNLRRQNSGRRKNEDMVTERLHYFHPRVNGQKYSFGNTDSAFSDSKLDDLCPASLEQRVTACTDVFDVWNTEARRRRVSVATRGSFHNPRRRTLSSGLSSFSFVSAEGSTSGRERAVSDSISRSSSSSTRSNTLVIRITPSNSSGSLSDLPGASPSEKEACGRSSPSSGCVGETEISEIVGRELPVSLGSSSSQTSVSDDVARSVSEIYANGSESENDVRKEKAEGAFACSIVPRDTVDHRSGVPEQAHAAAPKVSIIAEQDLELEPESSRCRRLVQRMRRFCSISRWRAHVSV